MRAIGASLAFVVTLVGARTALAAPTVTITAPAADAVVDDLVNVGTTVSSPYAITSVVATIGTASKTLTASAGNAFSGQVDITAVPTGPATLSVTATDAIGDTTTLTRSLKHDHAPTVVVSTLGGTVARPTMQLKASCTDTDAYPCASVTVAIDATVLASGSGPTASFDQVVSLAAWEQKKVTLRFTATDTAGRSTTRDLVAFVDSNPRLVLVDEVPGWISDFDATRLLYQVESTTEWTIEQRATGATTTLGTDDRGAWLGFENIQRAWLTADGAVWPFKQWRSGTGTTEALSPAPTSFSFRANGSWAVWSEPANVYRRNLATGVTETIATSSNTFGTWPVDVDSAGNVAWSWPDPLRSNGTQSVYFSDGATTTRLDPATTTSLRGVVIEGGKVVFHRHMSTGTRAPIHLASPGATEELDSYYGAQPPDTFGEARPRIDYRRSGGWTAYTKVVGGKLTAWTRSPSGTTALANPLTAVKAIAGLNDVGELLVDVGDSRYLGQATSPLTAPLLVGSANGEGVFRDGNWYVMMGRSLFRIETGSLPDGGVGDSGTGPDAGDDASASSSSGSASGSSGASGSGSSGVSSSASSSSGSSGTSSSGSTDPEGTNEKAPGSEESSSCSQTSGTTSSAGFALAMLAFVGALLRRRQRSSRD